MALLDKINGIWLLPAARAQALCDTYLADRMGGFVSQAALVDLTAGRTDAPPFERVGRVAVVSLTGVLTRRPSMFEQLIYGMEPMGAMQNAFAAAQADPAIDAVLLAVDSPGGQVDGVQQFAAQVAASRAGGKPTWALIDGSGTSAAYWIASGAERVLIADKTTQTGSIGVVTTHVDVSGALDKAGVKVTEITAGRYKRAASSYAPLTDEGRATLQYHVDAIYTAFVDDVSAHRALAVDHLLTTAADGRVFVGAAAIEAGLVDGVSTLPDAIAELAQRPGVGRASQTPIKTRGKKMDREQLTAEAPALVDALLAEGHAAGMTAGIEAERARIAALDAAAVPGHDALMAQARAEGWDDGRFALAVLAADRAALAAAADAHRADAAAPLPDAPPAETGANTKTAAQFDALSIKDQRAFLRAGGRVND
jgi:signal peptide peptidase SppA